MKAKLILSVLFSLIVSVFSGVGISMALEASTLPFVASIFFLSFIPLRLSGVAMEGVFREVWTKKIIEEMSEKEKGTFLDGIEDFSRYVSAVGDEAQAIHSVYMGVRPDVLINNTTYPIAVQELGEEDVTIQLDKYQTKQTPITDDELFAMTYDKIQVVKSKHAKAIAAHKIMKSIHALAPSSSTSEMPVLVTTGGDDGNGRKKLVWEDLLKLKRQLDNLEVPEMGRRLVLCTDHFNDLLLLDQKFKDQYFNAASGKPYAQLGFDFFTYVANPYFDPATKTKKSFGSVPAGTDQRATVLFSLERAAKAQGWTKMYYSEAKTDPAYQRNMVNFRHYFITLPTREEARGAIISDNV